jgi:hypothetical protein
MKLTFMSRGSSGLVVLALVVMLAVGTAHSSETVRRPVSIHSLCPGSIVSAVIVALTEEFQASPQYRIARTLSDEGQMDVVLTIQLNCAERDKTAAIATVYGQAKCLSETNCHLSTDGLSLRSALCDSAAVDECGHTLYKAFDSYVNNPNRPVLQIK